MLKFLWFFIIINESKRKVGTYLLNEIKEKASKTVTEIIKSGESLLEYGASGIETLNKKLTINDSEEDQTKIEAVTNCPYLEEKCSDIDCPCPKYKAYEMMQEPGLIERKITELGIDPNQDSWNVLMGMQKIFAGRFHNTTNMTKDEKDKWIKEYLICIEDEIGEFIDYVRLPLNSEATMTNHIEMQKEVIDILHFVMDVFIAGEVTPEEVKQAYLKHYTAGVVDVEDFLKFAYDQEALLFYSVKEDQLAKGIDYNEIDRDTMLLDLAMRLLLANRKVRQQISWKHWKKPNAEINREKLLEAYAHVFSAFMNLVIFTFDNAAELKQTYVKKNIENILRQELGY